MIKTSKCSKVNFQFFYLWAFIKLKHMLFLSLFLVNLFFRKFAGYNCFDWSWIFLRDGKNHRVPLRIFNSNRRGWNLGLVASFNFSSFINICLCLSKTLEIQSNRQVLLSGHTNAFRFRCNSDTNFVLHYIIPIKLYIRKYPQISKVFWYEQ